jgi:glycosyltransferase involved in cell wall biosynthesis
LNTDNKFTVGVIIPNFNDCHYLGDCLESVLSQIVPFDQIIFIDDASTDESVTFFRKTMGHRPEATVIVSEENKGTVLSINHALKYCTCDYVLFMSANDLISCHLVERFHATLKYEAGFWSALCQNVSDDGKQFFPRKTPVIAPAPQYFSASRTVELMRVFTNWSPGTTVLYNREKVLEHGGLSAPLKGLADWLLAVIVGVKSGVVFVPEILGTVRLHSNTYLGSTLQNNVNVQSATEAYLRDQLKLIPALKSNEIDMIINRVVGRLKLNFIIRVIQHSGSASAKLFHVFQLVVLLLRFTLSRGFLSLMMAKYISYMRIFKAS